MTSNLALLQFKSGVQRDGTGFQGDYCIDANWTRFQRGKPKKMRGMKAPDAANTLGLKASELVLLPSENQIYYYICAVTGIFAGTLDKDTFDTATPAAAGLIPGYNNPQVKWQSQIVINANQRLVVFLATNNGRDISQNTASRLYHGTLFSPNNLTAITTLNPLLNGGMCYNAPYLFLYGSNGLIQWSASNDPLDFTTVIGPDKGGSLTISNDKVIYGSPVRGGANSLSVLFWTLSSIIVVSNVGDNEVEFKPNTLPNKISILSSKCVVEYDGFFFWPGTDRFFVYNGVVTEMINTMSLNYFFDNLDYSQRQKVFGVKNTRDGEIWWHYPEKGQDPNANGGITNTRAIIYNKRENSWYDTPIRRDCGIFSDDFGMMVTYGLSLTNPAQDNYRNFIWRHEYNVNEVVQNGQNAPIPSSFTTPIFGWSCFNPVNRSTPPIDRWMDLERIEPDFILADADNMTVTVKTQEYAQSPKISSATYTFNGLTKKIDTRVQGRQLSLTFSSSSYFEMGNIMLHVGVGDGQ